MSFLSAFFLIASPLALTPLVLHLFDRRRSVTIEWGAMQFLEAALTQRTSARRLKHWLLLALRMLAVTALVLALARPMLPGNWLGLAEQSETIVIIDNSMSTQRHGDGSNLATQILDRTVSELRDLPHGNIVRVLQASPYPIWVTSQEQRISHGLPDELKRQLATIHPTSGGSDLLAALLTAAQADIVGNARSRRVLLVTDGQASDWKTSDTSDWQRLQETLRTTAIPTELQIVEVRPPKAVTRNLAINSIKSSRVLIGVGQSLSLTAHVQNYSTTESAGCRLRWLVDGRAESISEVPSLLPGNSHDSTWRRALTRSGAFAISCELVSDSEKSPDDLVPDNRATVVVEAREEVPVLVVESAAGQSELQQDSFFVQAAMGWVNGTPLEDHSVFRPVVVSPDDLKSIGLSDFHAVVIPNFTQLDPVAVDRLKGFVTNGGGLWIALGPRGDVEAFNQHLFAAGEGLSALGLEGIVTEPDLKKSPAINPAVRNHPATAELADHNRLDTSDIRVRRRFRFTPSSRGDEVSVLLGLSNGEPLAVEKYVGQGRVIVMGIPLVMRDWSDLTKSQAFVVMVQDWMSYLTQPQATRHNLQPGDPIVLQLPEASHREAVLKTPAGDQIELAAEPLLKGVMFRSTRSILPGDYHLQLGLSGETIPFHVQRPLAESNLQNLTSSERQLLNETAAVTRNRPSSDMPGHTHLDSMWPILLFLLIAFMCLELMLSGMISRERFGMVPIPETSERTAHELSAPQTAVQSMSEWKAAFSKSRGNVHSEK